MLVIIFEPHVAYVLWFKSILFFFQQMSAFAIDEQKS